MNFKDWFFVEQEDIRFTSFWSDGTIIVYIGDKRYVYSTNNQNEIKQIAKFKPWSALNRLKELIKKGLATQIEPAVPVQKTLF